MATDFSTCKVGNTEWMVHNLRETDGGEGITYNPKTDDYYYTFDATQRIANTLKGWRLPTVEESKELVRFLNDSPTLIPAMDIRKCGYFMEGRYWFVGDASYTWSTGLVDEIRTNYVFHNDDCTTMATAWGNHGFSVRLVKATNI